MFNKITTGLIEVVQQITPETNLPLLFSLFIEFCSNLQIVSLALLPLLQADLSTQNHLSAAANKIISLLKPFEIVNPFSSQTDLTITLIFCSLYLVTQIVLLTQATLKIHFKQQSIGKLIAKILHVSSLFHSKVTFYLIHCLVVRIISGNCYQNSACSTGKIIGAVILLILNTSLSLFEELFCYQIHQNTQSYGLKNNLHNIAKLLHKILIPILFYSITKSAELLIVFNILFTLHDLIILHLRIPFYNLNVLKLSIACSTISASCSIFAIGKYSDSRAHVLLVAMAIIPLIVKASLMRLQKTLTSIISDQKFLNSYQAVHLPILLENYSKFLDIAANKVRFNKTTLFSMGFISNSQQETININSVLDIHRAASQKALQNIIKTLDKHPKDELLIICIAQFYIQILDDGYAALIYLNKLTNTNLTLAARISIQTLSNSLMSVNLLSNQELHGKEKKRVSHYSYFNCRQKTIALKKYIQAEIQEHLKFWRNLNSTKIDILATIHQVSQITTQVHNITTYWTKNFENQEALYVNASIIYALYLEIIRAIPSGGSALLRKAQSSINNKWHINRDVIDIAMGNSAVIVASIESDKIGRIIDTSSSVTELFKTNKQGLIGANIGVVLPNIISAKHNDFIRAYQKNSKEMSKLDQAINSYAKTFQDDYFRVQVTLHHSPLIYKELSLFAFIQKTSDYQSLMFIDQKGFIIEYSQDLGFSLNLVNKKGSYVKIESLCPKFKLINQAFNMLYQSTASETVMRQSGTLVEESLLQSPVKSPHFTDNFVSPSARPLRINSTENDVPLTNSSRHAARFPFNEAEMSTTTRGNQPSMTLEEAQIVWDQYRGNNEFNFLPYSHILKMGVSRRSTVKEVKYFTKIEPFCFDGNWYKIVKLDKTKHFDSAPTVGLKEPTVLNQPPPPSAKIEDPFADNFPQDEERSDSKSVAETLLRTNPDFPRPAKQKSSNDVHQKEEETNENHVDFGSHVNLKRYTSNAASKSDPKLIQTTITRKLQSLKIEQPSKSSRIISTMFSFTILCVIAAICIHFFCTSQSLQEMRESNDLTMLVNSRLSKTIISWQGILILYARSCKLRPLDYRVQKYQQITINTSLDVINNAKDFAEEIDKQGNKDVVKTLYSKAVSLWEPHTHKIFNNEPIDQFAASQVLNAYYLRIARYNGSILDLEHDREMLFAVNNSGNDYLLQLDRSINFISDFFQETKDNNMVLLKGIAAVEIFVIVVPVVLIFVALATLIKKYSQLFETLGRIHSKSLEQRLTQLQDISGLFQETIEEDISGYLNKKNHDFRDPESSLHFANKKPNTIYVHREYKIKSLVLYILKYVLLAVILTSIVVALVAFAFSKSTQSLDDLDELNQKALTTYHIKSQIQMLLSSFYMTIMFYNQTDYKVRNKIPAEQLLLQYQVFGNATNIMLETFKDANNEISDPVIKEIFAGKPCKYVTDVYYLDCLFNTQGESIGLLGLHTLYFDACTNSMKLFVTTPNPTWNLGKTLSGNYAAKDPNLRFVIFDLYDYISDYLVRSFVDLSEKKRTEILKILIYTVIVALVSLKLIGTVVLGKLKLLDLGVRRTLRVIPDRIVRENKILSFYVSHHFKNEYLAKGKTSRENS